MVPAPRATEIGLPTVPLGNSIGVTVSATTLRT